MNNFCHFYLFSSLQSADLVSSMKIPACVQPATLLPSIWPYKYFGSYSKTNMNERLWAVMSGRHLLELSAFDSQRRRDSSGRGSLALRYVYPSDSIITTLVSTFYEEEVVRYRCDRITTDLFNVSASICIYSTKQHASFICWMHESHVSMYV